jgi:sterol desaturase/sphingolipid hydroxylase (fatty acid hydroxylase superfamily)
MLMQAALQIGFVLIILAAFFWTIERLFPENPAQPRWRRDSGLDVVYWFFNGIVTQFVVTAITVMVFVLAFLTLPRIGLSFVQNLPGVVQVLLVLLLGDLIFYWTHRISHHHPFFWKLHAIHHSPEQLDWLAAARVHPFDTIFHRVAAIIPLYLLGVQPGILAAYAPLLAFYPIFVHANIRWGYGWLGYVIASPAFHRWHHSSDAAALDKNFSGLFPVFDFIFGTAYFPRKITVCTTKKYRARSGVNWHIPSAKSVRRPRLHPLFSPTL